jgi:hypothetical protein
MNKKLKQKIEEARQTIEWLDKDDDLALYIAELLVKIELLQNQTSKPLTINNGGRQA